MKIKKIWGAVLSLTFMLLSLSLPCQAFIEVIDVTSIAKEAEVLAENVKQVQAAYDQISNQMKMLTNMAKNIANMPQDLANQVQNDVQNNIKALMNLQNDVKGMSFDYKNLQAEWEMNYPDFKDTQGMSLQDYTRQWDQMVQSTSDAIYDAVQSQGLIAQIGDDQGNLARLLQASQSAEGILAATQAGNQIAAQNTQQLMRLQQIIATSNRAQMQYLETTLQDRKRAQKVMEDAVNEHYDKVNDMMRLSE